MTPDEARFLVSPEGCEVVSVLDGEALDPLAAGTRLREAFPGLSPSYRAAAMQLAVARSRAERKFSRAEAMFFTTEALEQATGETVSRYRARRFSGLDRVLDAGAGIGGDAVMLGSVTGRLTCIERDPARAIFLRENLAVYGLAAEVLSVDLAVWLGTAERFDAVFVDPSRRSGGRRTSDLNAMEPPPAVVDALLELAPRGCVKLPPGLDPRAVAGRGELEWISTADGLKEAVLWTGGFQTCRERVTLLHRNCSVTDADFPPEEPRIDDPRRYLYEPDPALIRSILFGPAAAARELRLISPGIAYLTGDRPVTDPPLWKAYRIIEWFPFSLKRLRSALARYDAGEVTVKKRGFPLLPEEVLKKLDTRGSRRVTVVLTRVRGRHAALIVEPVSGDM